MLNLNSDNREAFMGQFIIVNSSTIVVSSPFNNYSLLAPITLNIMGNGHATVSGERVCEEGDEGNVIATCPYTTGAFTTPGTVTITISEAKTSAYVASLKPVITAPQWKVKCVPGIRATNPVNNQPDTSIQEEKMIEVNNPNKFVSVVS